MANVDPGIGGAYPNHNLTVKTFPYTTIHPNEIEAGNNKYFGGIALAVVGVPGIGAALGVGRTLAALISLLGVKVAVDSAGQDPYTAYPFRFQVTEFKYLLKKPTMTDGGFAIYRVYDAITGKSMELKKVIIGKTGI
ncbi:MAG: hypothetical protein H9W82_12165 [Lactobacillus sp.]|nr:hypothetical protein [Lactobacillus sp.]